MHVKELRILIVEDSAVDAELMELQLINDGYAPRLLRVETGPEMQAALESDDWDLVLSDFSMPRFSGLQALDVLKGTGEDIPFILISGSAGEEVAVKAMKSGAHDFFVKGKLALLSSAIERELREADVRSMARKQRRENEAQQKVAEEQLREAHARLREVLDHSPAVLYALSVEGDQILPRYASDNITRLLGYPVSETLTQEWWYEQLHPDDHERAELSLVEALTDGASRTEYRIKHKDGTYRWIDDNRRVVRDQTGKPVELVGAWQDVTERKQAQDELRENERRLREMLNNLELVSIMLDADGCLTYCNDYFLRLTGWERQEVLDRDYFELFVPEDIRAGTREKFSKLIADLPEAWHHENEIVTRAGQRRRLQWNNSVLRSATGEVIGTASIAEDVTDRKNLEKQMLRTQRMESIGTLAGGIAHDLNNLLMPILMGAALLKRFHQGESSMRVIDNIERSVKRGSELVKQVLLFARGGDTARAAVQLRDTVNEVESILRSTFPKNVSLEISLAKDLSQVTGDATQMTQVLLNLCVNARDAMPRGGLLSITGTNATLTDQEARLLGGMTGGPHVVLEVSDTGEGIAPEIIDRIFDPFFTTKEVGTGLGLSTAQGIITSHGGFLGIVSKPNEGTTFKVYLPARPAGDRLLTVEERPELPIHGNGELILVVDDDPAVVDITRQTLEVFGYEVISAEDGAQALEIYTRRRSDISLVLVDMMMPVMDGPTLIAALLRMDANVGIVGVTGRTTAAITTQLARMGVTQILNKPYDANLLLRTVAAMLLKSTPAGARATP
jgi:PAS domain S-box-containing protein